MSVLLLRQSTAVTLKLGPYVDSTDGDTDETGLTIAQADVRLSKNGGNMAQKNEGSSCTHDEIGYYDCPVDTTDTGTLGRLKVMVHKSGALHVWGEFMVIPAAVYDSLVLGTDVLPADLTQIGGVAQRATDLAEIAQFLFANAATLTSVLADDSVIAKLLATDGTVSGYNEATDALQALRDLVALIPTTAMRGTDGVDTATMRGTDLAALASAWTAARAGYQDNLNISENVAGTSEVAGILNNTRAQWRIPPVMERPDSGSETITLEIFLYDTDGNMEAPDAAPTISAVDDTGASRDVNLSSTTMSLVSTGRYSVTYTVADSHAIERVRFTISVVESAKTRLYGGTTQIVDTTAVDFTAADRTKLDTLHDTRLTAGRADNLDEITAARLTELDVANLPTDIDTLLARITALIATKAEMDTAHGLLATPAQVNAQVLDVMNADPFTQPGKVALPNDPTIVFMLGMLYKALVRNKNIVNTTTGVREIYDDGGTVVDQEGTVADDGLIFTEGELGIGT